MNVVLIVVGGSYMGDMSQLDISSSFSYRGFFGGKKLLVIVPHQDDEINVGGSTIIGATEEGVEVFLAFMTNGDCDYEVPFRNNEALNASRYLNVPPENICFLDYPDCGFPTLSVYEHKNAVFNYRNRKISWGILLNDIEQLILKVQPDAIICTGFDSHRDHRQCEEAVLTVMRKLWAGGNKVKLYSTFAYGNAYESVNDWRGVHWYSSVMNPKACPKGYSTPSKNLTWNERIRIPVPPSCRNHVLVENPLYQALGAHESQAAYRRGMKLINSDQVYWYRGPHADDPGDKYIQILFNGNFAYDWVVYKGEKYPEISIYLGNSMEGKVLLSKDTRVAWHCNNLPMKSCSCMEIFNFMNKNDVDTVVLKCELRTNPKVYSESILRRGTLSDWFGHVVFVIKDWLRYRRDHYRRRERYRQIQKLKRPFRYES